MIDLGQSAFKLKAFMQISSPALNRKVYQEMIENGIQPELAAKIVLLAKHEVAAINRVVFPGGTRGGRNPSIPRQS